MKPRLLFIIVPLILSCSCGEKQVYLNEMFSLPIIELTENGLKIKTENSKENSALLIFNIQTEIDIESKEIRLKGFQAAGKKYREEFKIELENEVLENIKDYRIFWIDPDNRKNELKIKNAL